MHTGRGDRLRYQPFSQLSNLRDLDLDLDLGSGHMAYHRVALIDLCLHGNFVETRKSLCGRMDIWTNIWPALLIHVIKCSSIQIKKWDTDSQCFRRYRRVQCWDHMWELVNLYASTSIVKHSIHQSPHCCELSLLTAAKHTKNQLSTNHDWLHQTTAGSTTVSSHNSNYNN